MYNSSATRHEISAALRDALPFLISLLLSFIMIGILGKKQGMHLPQLMAFSAMVMSAPLQWVLLEAAPQALDVLSVAITAFSINLRFFLFSMSLRSQLDGPVRRFMPALAVMGNAAFTMMAAHKDKKLSLAYVNASCFALYGAALSGTALGYLFANVSRGIQEKHMNAVLAIFIAISLGKQLREKHMWQTQLSAFLLCLLSLHLLHEISWTGIMLCVLSLSFLYDRP